MFGNAETWTRPILKLREPSEGNPEEIQNKEVKGNFGCSPKYLIVIT